MPTLNPPPLAQYGPFYGMRYAYDPTDNGENSGFVYDALNMLPADPVKGGAYLRRPADERATVGAGTLVAQWLGVFRLRSGFVNVGIFSGEIYTRSGTTWTKRITTANLTAAGITVSGTRPCGCVTYTNKLIVNDSVNQPFMWDGTAGGGLTLLTNAPAKCYGVPVVYYGKLFFIKDVAASSADRSTIVWSEENAPNTGYEAVGYTDSWTLEQSGSGAIYALAATNEALYFFRQHGIGAIHGAVTTTFSSDGVHDGISTVWGTDNAFGVLVIGERVYFLATSTGELCVILAGEVKSLGADVQDVLGNTKYLSLALTLLPARLVAFPFVQAIVVAYNLSTGRSQNLGGATAVTFLYSIDTHRCIGRLTTQYGPSNSLGGTTETGASLPAVGEAYDATYGLFQFTSAAVNAATTYTHHCPPSPATTQYDNTNQPSTFQVALPPIQAAPGTQFAVDEVETFFDLLPTDGGTVTASTVTIASRQSNVMLVGGTTSDVGSVTLTPDATYRQETRSVIGVNEHWRNVQLLIRDSGTLRNYPWGVKRVLVRGATEPIEPASA
jgi:hypothetical protein